MQDKKESRLERFFLAGFAASLAGLVFRFLLNTKTPVPYDYLDLIFLIILVICIVGGFVVQEKKPDAKE